MSFIYFIFDTSRNYHSLSESTPSSTAIYDAPRIYPSLPEYTPLFNIYMRTTPASQNISASLQLFAHSHNVHLSPRMYPLLTSIFFPLRIHPPSQTIPKCYSHSMRELNSLSVKIHQSLPNKMHLRPVKTVSFGNSPELLEPRTVWDPWSWYCRCISYIVIGSDEYHSQIRDFVVNQILEILWLRF